MWWAQMCAPNSCTQFGACYKTDAMLVVILRGRIDKCLARFSPYAGSVCRYPFIRPVLKQPEHEETHDEEAHTR